MCVFLARPISRPFRRRVVRSPQVSRDGYRIEADGFVDGEGSGVRLSPSTPLRHVFGALPATRAAAYAELQRAQQHLEVLLPRLEGAAKAQQERIQAEEGGSCRAAMSRLRDIEAELAALAEEAR